MLSTYLIKKRIRRKNVKTIKTVVQINKKKKKIRENSLAPVMMNGILIMSFLLRQDQKTKSLLVKNNTHHEKIYFILRPDYFLWYYK